MLPQVSIDAAESGHALCQTEAAHCTFHYAESFIATEPGLLCRDALYPFGLGHVHIRVTREQQVLEKW